jgi:hypothetical protein
LTFERSAERTREGERVALGIRSIHRRGVRGAAPKQPAFGGTRGTYGWMESVCAVDTAGACKHDMRSNEFMQSSRTRRKTPFLSFGLAPYRLARGESRKGPLQYQGSARVSGGFASRTCSFEHVIETHGVGRSRERAKGWSLLFPTNRSSASVTEGGPPVMSRLVQWCRIAKRHGIGHLAARRHFRTTMFVLLGGTPGEEAAISPVEMEPRDEPGRERGEQERTSPMAMGPRNSRGDPWDALSPRFLRALPISRSLSTFPNALGRHSARTGSCSTRVRRELHRHLRARAVESRAGRMRQVGTSGAHRRST